MNQGKERFCNGCFTLITPFDPDAFRVGAQWFHNGRCQQKMLDRSYELYLRRLKRDARKQVRAA
jgi:hypothetical protein